MSLTVEQIESTIRKHFPNATLSVTESNGSRTGSIYFTVRFALFSKDEWTNGIFNNDPASTTFLIFEKGEDLYSMDTHRLTLMITPEGKDLESRMAFSKVSHTIRKISGDGATVTKKLGEAFKKFAKLVMDNKEKIKEWESIPSKYFKITAAAAKKPASKKKAPAKKPAAKPTGKAALKKTPSENKDTSKVTLTVDQLFILGKTMTDLAIQAKPPFKSERIYKYLNNWAAIHGKPMMLRLLQMVQGYGNEKYYAKKNLSELGHYVVGALYDRHYNYPSFKQGVDPQRRPSDIQRPIVPTGSKELDRIAEVLTMASSSYGAGNTALHGVNAELKSCIEKLVGMKLPDLKKIARALIGVEYVAGGKYAKEVFRDIMQYIQDSHSSHYNAIMKHFEVMKGKDKDARLWDAIDKYKEERREKNLASLGKRQRTEEVAVGGKLRARRREWNKKNYVMKDFPPFIKPGVIEALPGNPVKAYLATEDGTVKTSWGADLKHRKGIDWILEYGPGDMGVVDPQIFKSTYEKAGDGTYTKKKIRREFIYAPSIPIKLKTLEGIVKIKPNAPILRGSKGEIWAVENRERLLKAYKIIREPKVVK